MAFKLALAAQDHWRKVNAPHLVELVRASVEFKDGKKVVPLTSEVQSFEELERIAA